MRRNNRERSGQHCSFNPAITPEILFTSRKFKADKVSITDGAAFILDAPGMNKPAQDEGKSQWN